MSVRDAARQAWLDSQQEREGEARQALAAVLDPYDVGRLETVDLTAENAWTRFVVTDGEVFLAAVRRGNKWRTVLVVDDDGWTEVGEFESLAQLGAILPDEDGT